jgi:hypothetical protein
MIAICLTRQFSHVLTGAHPIPDEGGGDHARLLPGMIRARTYSTTMQLRGWLRKCAEPVEITHQEKARRAEAALRSRNGMIMAD